MLKIIVFLFLLSSCSSLSDKKSSRKAGLYEKIGISFLQQKNYPSALSRFLKASQLDKNSPSITNYLGLSYFALKKYKLSLPYFKKAIKLQPKQTEYKNNLAYALIKIRKYKTAFNILKKNLKDLTYPSQNKTYFYISLIQAKVKNFKLAYKAVNKSLALNKNFCPANVQLATLLHKSKQYTQSIQHFSSTFLNCPSYKNSSNLFIQAVNYHKSKQYLKAISIFKTLNKKGLTSKIKNILKPGPPKPQ